MKQELFWSLVVESGWVQAAIWNIEKASGSVSVVSSGTPIPWGENGDLIEATDSTLSAAVAKLPEDVKEPENTVFGVSPAWVEKGQIKVEFLEKIQGICSKLSLKPTGFVVLPEAIAHLTKTKEGSPLSAIVVGVSQEVLDVTIFNLGKIVGSESVSRSVSVVDDMVEALTRLGPDKHLPARVLLYDGKEAQLEEVKQEILAADWETDKTNFVHTPRVEIVDPDDKALSVCVAGASEMTEVKSVAVSGKYKGVEDKGSIQAPINLDKEQKPEEQKDNLVPEDVGFAVNQDIAQDNKKEEKKVKNKKIVFPKPRINIGGVFGFLKPGFLGKGLWVYGAVVLLVFLFAAIAAWWFLPSATVTVFVSPKKLEKEVAIQIDSRTQSVDVEAGVLPGKVVVKSVSGDKTTSTSGTKKVGERAKGSVTVRNGTASAIQLAAGTSIFGPNDLEFTIDSSASISAALSPSSPGTGSVEVTAADIGAAYNLAQDESFKVSNYPKSDVDAVVASDFSGGSSREIASVDQKDREDLESELSEELKLKAEEATKADLPADMVFVGSSSDFEEASLDFSHKVGDEASTLKLSMSLESTGVLVARDDLNEFIAQLLKNQVPMGFVLREDQVEIDFSVLEEDGEVWRTEGILTANLLPEIDPDEVARKISGKYPPLAQEFLATVPGYSRAEIRLSPALPGKLGSLPRIVGNITVEIAAD